MYTVVNAIGVPLGLNERWQVVDLTAYTVAQLFTDFRIVQIELTPQGATSNVYLQLSAIASTYASYSGLFSALLASIGNTALPTTTTGYVLNERSAIFADAFKAGYTVTPVDTSNVVPPYTPSSQLPNVRLTRTDIQIDYNYMAANCLVNVNGYYHATSTDGVNGVVVANAMKSLELSGQNQIGLWNFGQVASFTSMPITPAMVNYSVVAQPVVNLGIDLTGKSVALILGGYFVFIDNSVLTQVGASSFQINFTQIDLANRYYESANYIDVSSILAATPAANPNQIVVSDLTSPTAVAAWLAMSQTFFVVFNTAEMFQQQQFVKRSGIPQLYLSYTPPLYPMALSLGRHPPYWSVKDAGQWALTIYDNSIGNLLYSGTTGSISTSGANQPGSPGLLQEAYLVQVGSDVS